MEPPKLRLFKGETQAEQGNSASGRSSESRADLLPVAVRDLVPLLVDAFQSDRTWLKDFGCDHIHVSADLYEILLAYQQLRRYDAA
jgi:hypothetical protein